MIWERLVCYRSLFFHDMLPASSSSSSSFSSPPPPPPPPPPVGLCTGKNLCLSVTRLSPGEEGWRRRGGKGRGRGADRWRPNGWLALLLPHFGAGVLLILSVYLSICRSLGFGFCLQASDLYFLIFLNIFSICCFLFSSVEVFSLCLSTSLCIYLSFWLPLFTNIYIDFSSSNSCWYILINPSVTLYMCLSVCVCWYR